MIRVISGLAVIIWYHLSSVDICIDIYIVIVTALSVFFPFYVSSSLLPCFVVFIFFRIVIISTVSITGTNLARALAVLPPNVLNPQTYTDTVIKEMTRTYEWELTEWTSEELGDLGLY